MFNRVILIGRMATEVQIRYTPGGTPVANFRLAVNRPRRKDTGEQQTDFINIVAWRQQAEFCQNYLVKGQLIGVEGTLQIRSFVSREGQNKQVAEVVALRLFPLERRRAEIATAPTEPEPPFETYAEPADIPLEDLELGTKEPGEPYGEAPEEQ